MAPVKSSAIAPKKVAIALARFFRPRRGVAGSVTWERQSGVASIDFGDRRVVFAAKPHA